MFYTNGKILIHKQNNVEQLDEAALKIFEYMEETAGIIVSLEVDEKLGFPSIALPEDVGYKELDNVLRPYVQLKAINEDSIYVTEDKVINEKYVYSDEEKAEIADKISKGLKKVEGIEIEMKLVAKSYKAQIEEVKTKINELNDNYTQGYTYKDYTTKVKLNFLDGKKYFVDKDDDTLVHRVEKMDKAEAQLRIEHTVEAGVTTEPTEEEEEKTPSKKEPKEKKGPKKPKVEEDEEEEMPI